ncbi:hypothetical protein MMC31_008138 [Peltigera leucophlebia]|nr:hypothetical protein [Peltigera leucophlebia]
MAIPRHNAEGKEKPKKAKKGISIGPGNLPDGTHLRKVRKIQHDLIRKAKVKKSYQKLKQREHFEKPEGIPAIYQTFEEPKEPASLELHPDRQAMLSEPEVKQLPVTDTTNGDGLRRQPRERRRKKAPFEKEARLAEQRRAEKMAKRKEFEENRQKREQKLEERERFRKAMAKARVVGKTGQRKLGRESAILLEKAKRVMEQ